MTKRIVSAFLCLLLMLVLFAALCPWAARGEGGGKSEAEESFVPKNKDLSAVRLAVYGVAAALCLGFLILWGIIVLKKRKTKKHR